ncbi:unnamed protein product [Caenorhabditis bovis]|uniref:BHLH domain-containing protein n=1 Tax=Caenorhabditis bovis TaxID=2654633 RepID=A0A8S1F8S9_9PELO|nr:unnamed protein product [Caenorhabditis bovis]
MAPRRTDEFKKERSRSKEAKRAQQLNGAFRKLLGTIPYIPEKQREVIPKIKTLRLAMRYIEHLNRILDGNWGVRTEMEPTRPLQFDDFRFIADEEIKVRNSYRDRALNDELAANLAKNAQTLKNQRNRISISENEDPSLNSSSAAGSPPYPEYLEPTSFSIPPNTTLPNVYSIYGNISPPSYIASDDKWVHHSQ